LGTQRELGGNALATTKAPKSQQRTQKENKKPGSAAIPHWLSRIPIPNSLHHLFWPTLMGEGA